MRFIHVVLCGVAALGVPTGRQGDVRRVWTGDYEMGDGRPSPDGRLFAMTEWKPCGNSDNVGNIVLWELSTRKTIETTHYTECGMGAESPRFSPDGKAVAYMFGGNRKGQELRVSRLDSAPPRVLVPVGDKGQEILPQDWTANGAEVLIVVSPPGREPPHLAAVSSRGGPLRILKSFAEWRSPYGIRMRASPDGRFIAYSAPSAANDGHTDVNLLVAESGRDIPIFKDVALDYVVGWTPDGSRLVLGSDREKTRGLWALAIRDGKPGKLEKIRGDMWRMEAISMTAGGDVVYKVESGDRDVYMASVNPVTRQVLSVPTRVGGSSDRVPSALAFWSNDSRFFAFDATVGPAGGAGSHILTVSSVSGGEPREFRLPSAYVRSITWMPKNTALVLRVPDDKGRGMLQRLDLKTGKLTTFGSLEHVPRNWLVLARDGRSFYYIVTDMPGPAKGAVARIMVQEAATGKERVAYEAPKGEVIFGAFSYIPRFCLTPDGRSLIVPLSDDHAERATRVRLVLVNIADGTTRDLFVPAPGDSLPIMLPVQLSPDGRGVDVVRSKTSAGADRKAGWYWRVPLAGGSPQLLGPQSDDPEMVLDAGTPHSPDGRRVAFLKGKHAEELWVLRDDALRADTKPSGSSRR